MKFNFNDKIKNLTIIFKERIQRLFLVIKTAIENYGQHKSSTLAAGVTFFYLLSFLPMMFLLIAVFGYVLTAYQGWYSEIVDYIYKTVPQSANIIGENLKNVTAKRSLTGILSILGLLWTSSRLYAGIEDALNVAWNAEKGRHFVITRLRALGMGFLATLFLIFSITITSFATAIRHFPLNFMGYDWSELPFVWEIWSFIVPLYLSILMFFLIYRYIPNKKIYNKAALLGATVAGLGWELSKIFYSWYVIHIAHNFVIHGSLGAVLIMMLWIYYSNMILLFGAEVGSAYQDIKFIPGHENEDIPDNLGKLGHLGEAEPNGSFSLLSGLVYKLKKRKDISTLISETSDVKEAKK